MEDENVLTSESSCEQVSEYFSNRFNISEEAKDKLIQESITGDVLLDISKEDFTSFGITKNQYLKISSNLKKNKDKFKEKEISENLSSISTKEKIKEFVQKTLNFNGNLSQLDEKEFLELDEEKMKKLGFNYGQRKRLKRYIDYFKKLKDEGTVDDIEINISEQSTKDEINSFLKEKIHLSQKTIDELGLDAETLFILDKEQINEMDELNEEEKKNFKKFIDKRDILKKPKITKESKKEDIINFLKENGIDNDNILDINLDKLSNISSEESDILKSFIENEKQIIKNNQKNSETSANNINQNILNQKNQENINQISKKYCSKQKIKVEFQLKIQPLELSSNNNIFFVIIIIII